MSVNEGNTDNDLEAQIAALFDRQMQALIGAREEALALVAKAKPRKWLSLDQAAELRGVGRDAMARQAARFGLGTFTGRRWRIAADLLQALNEGRDFDPMNPFPEADTTNCGVENCSTTPKHDDSSDDHSDPLRAESPDEELDQHHRIDHQAEGGLVGGVAHRPQRDRPG